MVNMAARVTEIGFVPSPFSSNIFNTSFMAYLLSSSDPKCDFKIYIFP